MPFEDLFAAVIRHCRSSYSTLARRPPAGRHELPSAAIAFVRALPEKVELATLGDCRIAYRSLGGEEFAEHGDGGNIGPFEHRSEEHTSELQSLMRISYAVFCLKKKTNNSNTITCR